MASNTNRTFHSHSPVVIALPDLHLHEILQCILLNAKILPCDHHLPRNPEHQVVSPWKWVLALTPAPTGRNTFLFHTDTGFFAWNSFWEFFWIGHSLDLWLQQVEREHVHIFLNTLFQFFGGKYLGTELLSSTTIHFHLTFWGNSKLFHTQVTHFGLPDVYIRIYFLIILTNTSFFQLFWVWLQ